MKIKFPKQFVVGLTVGIVLSITTTAIAATQIRSAKYNDVSVTLNGQPIPLDQPLVSVVDEASPNFAANYMPLRAILEKLGYIVSWDGPNQNIELSKTEESSDLPETKTAKVLVDGKASDLIKELRLLEIPRENNTSEVFVLADDLLNLFETKDTPYDGVYNSESNTYSITTKPPFVEGKPLREVLDATGSKYEIQRGDGVITVELKSGANTATLSINLSGNEPGKVVFGEKTAEFQYYVTAGSTYIVEGSFLQALKDIGFIK